MSNNSSDNIILIGGVVGGVVGGVILLLIITGILCIVCIRRSRNTIYSHVPATPVPSYDVPRKTSEDLHNYVQLNDQSYGEGNKRNTNNSPTYEVSTGEDRVTTPNTTSGIRAHQSLSDDTSKEYDYTYVHVRAHDDQPLHHNTGVNTDQEPLKGPVYGVVTQPKSDGFDNENAEGQSSHTPTAYLPSLPPPNSKYGVINQHKSDGPNL